MQTVFEHILFEKCARQGEGARLKEMPQTLQADL